MLSTIFITLSFLIGTFLFFYHQLKDISPKHEKKLNNQLYFISTNKNTEEIGICGVDFVSFSLIYEKWYDGLFKWLQISKEFQVGSKHFDKKIYIQSDNKYVNKAFKIQEVQNLILELFNICEKNNTLTKSLNMKNGKLWISFYKNKKLEKSGKNLNEELLPLLSNLNDKIKDSLPYPSKKLHDKYKVKANMILVISTALLMTGMCLVLTILWGDKVPFTLERSKLINIALCFGMLTSWILVKTTFIFLGQTSRAHKVLGAALIFGFFGGATISASIARNINIDLDNSKPEEIYTLILNKKIKRGKYTSYNLRLKNWKNNSDKFYQTVSVSHDCPSSNDLRHFGRI